MSEVKEYELQNFDPHNIKGIKRLINFFLDKFPELSIKLFNELNGFYYNVNKRQLMKELDELSKKYTGLDEIILVRGFARNLLVELVVKPAVVHPILVPL